MRSTSIALLMIALVACGGESEPATTPTSEPPSTSTIPESTSTTSTVPATSTTTTTSTTTAPTTTAPDGTEADLTHCDSPEGYSIAYPDTWHTNSGEVVPECGQFDPGEFQVPEATDERVAAITAYIDPVPFSEVAADDEAARERAVTAVDGLQAVRFEFETDGEGLWPEGTPITQYAIDVSTQDTDATLFVDTVGLDGFDYVENQVVLDRMARTIDVEMEGVDDNPDLVATYLGGGGGFSVEALTESGQVCLRIPPDGEEVCTDEPASDQLHTIQLEDLEPVLAGVAGSNVFAVTAELREGGTSTVLPSPITDTDTGGFSFTVDLDAIERFILTDIEGTEINVIEPGG